MSENFSPRARKVMNSAAAEARRLGSATLDSEHILRAILMEGGDLAAEVVRNIGSDFSKVGEVFERVLQSDPVEAPEADELPLSPRAQRLVERAREMATRLGQDSIGLDHLLFGFQAEAETVAATVHLNLQEVLRQVQQHVKPEPTPPPPRPAPPPPASDDRVRMIKARMEHLEASIESVLGLLSSLKAEPPADKDKADWQALQGRLKGLLERWNGLL